METKEIIELAWENREMLTQTTAQKAINEVIEALDKGHLRVAEPLMTEPGKSMNG